MFRAGSKIRMRLPLVRLEVMLVVSKADTKLEIKFENDIKQLLLTQLKNAGYLFNTKSTTEDVVRQYFNVIFREISNQPRTVRISKELLTKNLAGSLKIAFDDIVSKASSGGRLNQYLSMELLKPSYKDLLLYDWRIHHLHLGTTPDKGDPRFIERTGELLYVRVEDDTFYCIDVLDHDPVNGFANQALVQIIHDNWPYLLSSYRVNGILPHSLTNEMIHNVRQAHATAAISVSDGTTYFPVGGGYATDGSSINVTRSTDMLLGKLYTLEDAIKNGEANLRSQIATAVGRCPRTIKIKLKSWDETGVLALEKKTNQELRFPWVN